MYTRLKPYLSSQLNLKMRVRKRLLLNQLSELVADSNSKKASLGALNEGSID